MKKDIWLVSLCLFLLSSSAQAEFYTGNNLKGMLDLWEKNDPKIEAQVGAGYVLGVHDALSGYTTCSPTDVTATSLIKTVLRYMRATPEVLNATADRVVAAALKDRWPCAKDSEFAKYWRGNDLQTPLRDWENSEANDKNSPLAAGYLDGVFDAASGVLLCPPEGVTNNQITSITLKFMRQDPEILNLWGDAIILKALTPLWPCKKSSSDGTPEVSTPQHKQPKPKAAQPDSPF